jgi:hypothetical protein
MRTTQGLVVVRKVPKMVPRISAMIQAQAAVARVHFRPASVSM